MPNKYLYIYANQRGSMQDCVFQLGFSSFSLSPLPTEELTPNSLNVAWGVNVISSLTF